MGAAKFAPYVLCRPIRRNQTSARGLLAPPLRAFWRPYPFGSTPASRYSPPHSRAVWSPLTRFDDQVAPGVTPHKESSSNDRKEHIAETLAHEISVCPTPTRALIGRPLHVPQGLNPI